jgi:transcription elongation factor Elf1
MIVNAAVFTCSICGEASVNICSYCTKDACSNHRCERCKRCSDCCECEFPLSAEEPVAVEAAIDPVFEPQAGPEVPEPEVPEPEAREPQAEISALRPEFPMSSFLTSEESSVFAEERAPREPRVFNESSVFAEEDEPADSPASPHPDDPDKPRY